MATITVETVWSTLRADSGEDLEELLDIVGEHLSWQDPNARFTEAYQNHVRRAELLEALLHTRDEEQTRECQEALQELKGLPMWDGMKTVLRRRKNEGAFPSGLASEVHRILMSRSIRCTVNDNREWPVQTGEETEIEDLAGIDLRQEQLEAIRAALVARRGIIKSPPGTGKTEILIALVNAIGVTPVVWLIHDVTLLHQTADRFKERLPGLKIGIVGDELFEPGDVTICTVQTVHKRLQAKNETVKNLLAEAQIVVCDEGHHAPADTWYNVLTECQAPFRFACSATPLDRSDGSNIRLIGATGPIVYELSHEEAADLGLLVSPDIKFIDFDRGRDAAALGEAPPSDWKEAYDRFVMNNDDRNGVILDLVEQAVNADRRVLVFIRRIPHGHLLYKKIAGLFDSDRHVAFLYGGTSSELRRQAIEEFRKGIIRVIITSTIFDEGVDIPEIETVVLAGGGKSDIKTIQRIGRGVRTSEGKKDVEVYDFVDRATRLLQNHYRQRRRTCEKEFGKESVMVTTL